MILINLNFILLSIPRIYTTSEKIKCDCKFFSPKHLNFSNFHLSFVRVDFYYKLDLKVYFYNSPTISFLYDLIETDISYPHFHDDNFYTTKMFQ